MRPLPASTIDPMPWHKSIVDAKRQPRRGRLQAIEARVEERIAAFEAGGPITIASDPLGHSCSDPCSDCVYDDLRHLWESGTIALNELTDVVWEEFAASEIRRCPYCGINTADTLDHYLPKELFPEFSVNAANLIPCCGRCNLLKGVDSPTASTRVLHPRLDLVDVQLVSCEIVVSGGLPIPVFAVDPSAASAAGIASECLHHLDVLDLEKRLSRAAIPSVTAFLGELQSRQLPSSPGAPTSGESAQAARDRSESHIAQLGPNSWIVLTFDALATWFDGP